MRRREFITLLGGAAAAWPLAARAQQPTMPVIGFLMPRQPSRMRQIAWRRFAGAERTGFVEGQNVAIEYRWAEGDVDRLPTLAADLVALAVGRDRDRRAPTVRSRPKQATTTIPIVFAIGDRPGRGRPRRQPQPAGRQRHRLEVFEHELERQTAGAAAASSCPVTRDRRACQPEQSRLEIGSSGTCRPARASLGRECSCPDRVARRRRDRRGLRDACARTNGALLVSVRDPFFTAIANRSSRWRRATRFPRSIAVREFVAAGGLMSYGTSITDAYRRVGIYAGRILKGEKPADLPVMQPTKFEFVINLKTAKALGLDVPPTLLARADEVIE